MMGLIFSILWCCLLCTRARKISIVNSEDIVDDKHIELYIPSYPVIVVGGGRAIDLFDEDMHLALDSMVSECLPV
jgi:hypothetical protein